MVVSKCRPPAQVSEVGDFRDCASIIGGKLWQQDLLAYCAPLAGQPDGVLKVRVSDYPALGQAYGSVRLGLNPVSTFPDGDFYPILINRDASNNFYVHQRPESRSSISTGTSSLGSLHLFC